MHLDLETIKLGRGKHSASSGQACVMECVACLAGEEFTDMPKCVSPIIGAFMRNWNDQMDDDERQILKPLIPVVMNTATGGADDLKRSWMAMDWMLRVYTPSWLELAGLTKQAEALRLGAEIVDGVTLAEAMPSLITARGSASAAGAAAGAAARDAAWAAARAAAGAAARAAAWAAAWDAAGAAAGAAARDAAGAAARAAARAAAWAAARAAARAAAWDALRPTVASLQSSAIDLIKRMAQVGRP